MTDPSIERRCPACGHVGRGGPADIYCPHDGAVMFTVGSFARRAEGPLLGATLVDRFVVNGLLGVGGYGAVYQAWDPVLQDQVAIKVLTGKASTVALSRRRFLQEARLLRKLRSSHVVRVSDFGSLDDGTRFMVMDWVPGQPMTALYRQRPRPPIARMLGLLDQILEALGDVHAAGLVHRDLKPGNVIVGRHRGDDWITLIDFGIAKGEIETAQDEQPRTRTGTALGTPRYMAPEQFGTDIEITARTDVYAAGVMLYEILAGRPPFNGLPMEVAAGHLRDPIPELPPGTPRSLVELVHDAMARHPDQRVPDAATMRARLRAAAPFSTAPMPDPDAAGRPRVSLPPAGVTVSTTAEGMGEVTDRAARTPSRRAGWLGLGAVLVAGAVGVWSMIEGPPRESSGPESDAHRISLNAEPLPVDAAVAPDATAAGQRIAAGGPADAEMGGPDEGTMASATMASATGVGGVAAEPSTPIAPAPQRPSTPVRTPARRAPAKPSAAIEPRPSPASARPADPRAAVAPTAAATPARVAEVRSALAACKCDTAKTLIKALPTPPAALSDAVARCRIPDFDEVCRDGRTVPR